MRDLIKAIYSNETLERLYERRQALRPSEENRTKLATITCATLFFLVLIFLIMLAWARQDIASFVSSQPSILALEGTQPNWRLTPVSSQECVSDQDCYNRLVANLANAANLNDADLVNREIENIAVVPEKANYVLIRRIVQASSWQDSLDSGTLIFTLPRFNFHKAAIYLNEQRHATFYQNSEITIQMDFNEERDFERRYTIDLLLELDREATSLTSYRMGYTPEFFKSLAVMPTNTHHALVEYIASDRAARGDFIGMLARIIMAVFVLALFLLVDGSPETLGLALFLGFEAFAISLRFNWFPVQDHTFLMHYSYQMGDIMRLYFFLQLARMIDKKVTGWLIWGSVLSVPYGLLRVYAPEFDITWAQLIPRHRDTIIGVLGVIICVRAAWYLRNKSVPWRVVALCVAGVASFEQIVDPIGMLLPEAIYYSRPFVAMVDILQPLSAWLFALSAFINISTLETRVKTLTRIESKAQEIRREMELGQTVQQAFFKLPKLPDSLQLSCHNEAMLYVSGDTYFVDWNEERQKLTFLINDVTGHGVQAALKASCVNVIANTIWLESKGDAADGEVDDNLMTYAVLVESFFRRNNHNPDVLAMGACEFNPTTGQLSLLRVNFPFPIIIEPKIDHRAGEESRRDDLWRVHLLPVEHKEVTNYRLHPGSFVLLASDGYLDGSRRTSTLMKYLRKHLAKSTGDITLKSVEHLIRNCPFFPQHATEDDRTYTLFKWNTFSLNQKTPKPGENEDSIEVANSDKYPCAA